MQEATIKSISIRKSKAGDNAIQIEVAVDGGGWAKQWIGVKAPDWVAEKWEEATGLDPMVAVSSGKPWEIIDKRVKVVVNDSEYGLKVEKVFHIDFAEDQSEEIKTDDVPF